VFRFALLKSLKFICVENIAGFRFIAAGRGGRGPGPHAFIRRPARGVLCTFGASVGHTLRPYLRRDWPLRNTDPARTPVIGCCWIFGGAVSVWLGDARPFSAACYVAANGTG
jgi:hypothetical protein